jgi:hypothetical protein
MSGYSGTTLIKKLGVKSGQVMYVKNAPAEYFDWISPLPESVEVQETPDGKLDFIHLFVKEKKTFQSDFVKSKKALTRDGMLWVSWPKKASKVETDLDENIIREFGLAQGLVDVKVCAVSEIWSGLKFVFRLKDR